MINKTAWTRWASSGFMVLICTSAAGQPAAQTGAVKEQDFGTIVYKARWPEKRIPVCWENPTPGDAHYRSIVRRSVSETWERYGALEFIGWAKCATNSRGIRIRVANSHPHVKAVGQYLDARPDGMVLNFSFETWSTSCQKNREFCTYAVAVHEFGHAIGFTHEQNRSDAPKECRADSQGTTGDFLVTRYDPVSVMNYCNPAWNGDGQLSELDILSVRTVYGE